MKIVQPEAWWDRLFAPSSALAIITTAGTDGAVNAAAFGTCTRVNHNPVDIAFTCRPGKDTSHNVLATREFVVNLPAFEREALEAVRVVGLPFSRGVNELSKAGLHELPSLNVRPPRIVECTRHFECVLEWHHEWSDRIMFVGRVVAASSDEDCVDAEGYVRWENARSAHFAGASYNYFVAAYEVMKVRQPYDGPEVEAYDAFEQSMFGEQH
ncbi:MAG TPA: flavin reductase family protein [Candidatus Lustribacter sp.]